MTKTGRDFRDTSDASTANRKSKKPVLTRSSIHRSLPELLQILPRVEDVFLAVAGVVVGDGRSSGSDSGGGARGRRSSSLGRDAGLLGRRLSWHGSKERVEVNKLH